jgi:TPR repeat protein
MASFAQQNLWTQVFDYYMPFALMGDCAAQFEIAEIWRHRYKCQTLAFYWYCRSAKGGHHKAAMTAAIMSLTAQPPDFSSALKWADIAIKGDIKGAKLVQKLVHRHATSAYRHQIDRAI